MQRRRLSSDKATLLPLAVAATIRIACGDQRRCAGARWEPPEALEPRVVTKPARLALGDVRESLFRVQSALICTLLRVAVLTRPHTAKKRKRPRLRLESWDARSNVRTALPRRMLARFRAVLIPNAMRSGCVEAKEGYRHHCEFVGQSACTLSANYCNDHLEDVGSDRPLRKVRVVGCDS
jgi:hypothetical protein